MKKSQAPVPGFFFASLSGRNQHVLARVYPLMVKRRLTALVLVATLLIADRVWSASVAPSNVPKNLLVRLDQARERAGVAGLGLVLVEGQSTVWTGGLGVADWQTKTPMSADTYIRIGSITKTLVGLAFAQMNAEGVLNLDRPLHELVDTVPLDNGWRETNPVTVAQLLEHTAGLRDLQKIEWDSATELPLAEALALAPSSRRAHWPPGLHSSYSNSGAGVAAWVMEQVTNADFESDLQRRVFKPLGMTSATLRLNDVVQSDLAAGYDRDGRRLIPYWHMLYRSFGAVNVRVRDVAPLLKVLLGRGRLDGQRVFAEAVIERTEHPTTTLAAKAGLKFGYGLGNYAWTRSGHVLRGHGGDADGYLAHFGYNTQSKRGYFIVINAFQGATLRQMRQLVESWVVEPLSKPAQPVSSLDPKAQQWVGRYQTVTSRFGSGVSSATVTADADGLWLQRGQRRQRLLAVAPGLYRRRHEPLATIAFAEHAGERYLQTSNHNYRLLGPPNSGSVNAP